MIAARRKRHAPKVRGMVKKRSSSAGPPRSPPLRTRRCSIASAIRIAAKTTSRALPFPNSPSMCPVTGQPDFATLVDRLCAGGLARRVQVAEALSQQLPQSRRLPRRLHGGDRQKNRRACSNRNGCASAAISIRAAACRSTCSGRPANFPPASGRPTRASLRIARADSARAVQRRDKPPISCAGSAARMTPPITATPAQPAAMTSPMRAELMPPMASTGTREARAISASPMRPISGP